MVLLACNNNFFVKRGRIVAMIRAGAVNIDTSHPMGFADAMKKKNRMHYVGVYNDSFRSDLEVDGFIARYGLENRCNSLEELAQMCDIGFIQGCDWDDHIRCAKPFIEMGKAVFIDKPLVGSIADCNKIIQLVKNGAFILGSSSARYAFEIQEFMSIPENERGEIVTVIGTAGVDEFNYGIHIVEAIGGILGIGAKRVRYIGKGKSEQKYCESFSIEYSNGKNAIFHNLTGTWQPFTITIITTKNTYCFKMDPNRLYEALIEQLCNKLEEKPNLIADTEALVESVKIMIAALASKKSNGDIIELSTLTEESPTYDGEKFLKEYSSAAGALYAL